MIDVSSMSPKVRRVIYFVFAIVGLALGATHVAYGVDPHWLTVAISVFTFLGGAVGVTAGIHTGPNTPVVVEPTKTDGEPVAQDQVTIPYDTPTTPVKAPSSASQPESGSMPTEGTEEATGALEGSYTLPTPDNTVEDGVAEGAINELPATASAEDVLGI